MDGGASAYIAMTALMLTATAASTGISMYGQQQQAKNASAIANYNYAVQAQNAKVQADMARTQAAWDQQNAKLQQQMAQQNAAALRDQASAAEVASRNEQSRMRAEKERALAQIRAKVAKSGVVMEGTPLDVLATSSGLLELNIQDEAYKGEMESRALRRKAVLTDMDARTAGFDASVAAYRGAAAEVGRSMDMTKAKIAKLSAQSSANGLMLSSYGTLLSGIGQTAGGTATSIQGYQAFKKT